MIALEGQNLKYSVDMLTTCILYYYASAGPGCLINCCKSCCFLSRKLNGVQYQSQEAFTVTVSFIFYTDCWTSSFASYQENKAWVKLGAITLVSINNVFVNRITVLFINTSFCWNLWQPSSNPWRMETNILFKDLSFYWNPWRMETNILFQKPKFCRNLWRPSYNRWRMETNILFKNPSFCWNPWRPSYNPWQVSLKTFAFAEIRDDQAIIRDGWRPILFLKT